ncbi:MAG: hypothetical protein PV344_03620 [Anaplasma sp.]|nr:hypothetical protein [Anaplasma sp.]
MNHRRFAKFAKIRSSRKFSRLQYTGCLFYFCQLCQLLKKRRAALGLF